MVEIYFRPLLTNELNYLRKAKQNMLGKDTRAKNLAKMDVQKQVGYND